MKPVMLPVRREPRLLVGSLVAQTIMPGLKVVTMHPGAKDTGF